MLKAIAMTTLLASLMFLTACGGNSLPKDESSTSTNTPTSNPTNSQDTEAKPSSNTTFKAELAIDLEAAKEPLTENERPALDLLEQNLKALVQHDHKQYLSGFVDEKLANAMDFYYGEQFKYKFTSIESIENNASIKSQVQITVLGERLDTTTDSVENVKMMYAIRKNDQGDWDIYTID